MNIYPAIELLDQQVVRLYQGNYQKQSVFGLDPLSFAKSFETAGARFLHLVDLNGAKTGTGHHFNMIQRIVENTSLAVEVGGGIREEKTIAAYLDAGVRQVILGTVAQRDPDFTKEMLKKYQEKIVIGVDVREGKVATEGWLNTTETSAADFCQRLADWGCRRIIYTDIAKDGTGAGIDSKLYQELDRLPLEITASGGVATLQDIEELKNIGIEGAIVGKALYQNDLVLEDILSIAGRQEEKR